MAERILDLGRQFDQAFNHGTSDFGTMDTTTAANWWSDSITHPEGFTFEASNAGQ